MNLRIAGFVSIVGVAAIGATFFGCSSTTDNTGAGAAASGNCPAVGSRVCTAESAVKQTDFDECNKSKADPKCGAVTVEYLKCAGSNVSCKADNKVDQMKLLAACKSQIDALDNCSGPASDGGTD